MSEDLRRWNSANIWFSSRSNWDSCVLSKRKQSEVMQTILAIIVGAFVRALVQLGGLCHLDQPVPIGARSPTSRNKTGNSALAQPAWLQQAARAASQPSPLAHVAVSAGFVLHTRNLATDRNLV